MNKRVPLERTNPKSQTSNDFQSSITKIAIQLETLRLRFESCLEFGVWYLRIPRSWCGSSTGFRPTDRLGNSGKVGENTRSRGRLAPIRKARSGDFGD